MVKTKLFNKNVLDIPASREIILPLLSFSGGENTVATDVELDNNEARSMRNFDSTSIGGLTRAPGIDKVADGGASYSEDVDLLIQHYEGATTAIYGVIEGDIVVKSTTTLALADNGAFTTGVLCHGVSAGGMVFITNATDNLKYRTIAGAVAAPTTVPTAACARIYHHSHVDRLIAEGDSTKTVYGSMAGYGNWVGAGGWTTANDAWSITLPDLTKGAVTGFPTGTDISVFTEFDTYIIYNQPNIAMRRVQNGIGCSAPMSIAKGNEGIFFVSKYPTLGVFLWDGVNFTNLTEVNDFVTKINFSQRIFGIYKDREYFLCYNKTGSSVTYPNTTMIFNTKFGQWKERAINPSHGDFLGYPALLTKTNNELYFGSPIGDKVYEYSTTYTDDDGYDMQSTFTTKYFTSRDFQTATGDQFPVDLVRIKLIGIEVQFKGTTGAFSVSWTADRGKVTGSQTFDMNLTSGALLNTTFTVNTSKIVGIDDIETRSEYKTFNNYANGYEFQFQINNNDSGARPEIKKIKIYALALEE